jgi:hypothetical protein
MLRCLLFLVLAVSALAQVPLGATKNQVIDQLGWPKSSSGSQEREILNYSDFTVFLVDGRVEKLTQKPAAAPVRPKPKQPVSAPVSPPATQIKPATQDRLSSPIVGVPENRPRQTAEPPGRAPSATVRTSPTTTASQKPQPDPFAPVRRILLIMGAGFGLVLGLKLILRDRLKKLEEEMRFLVRKSDVEPAALATGSQRASRPDPVKDGWSYDLLKRIEWHRFEHLVIAYEQTMGHSAELTSFGPDGGIDGQVFEAGTRTLKRVIQCKAFTNQKVGVELVRAFYGVMSLQKVSHGAFYTMSGFTNEALAIARENENLELVDGETLLRRIRDLKLSDQIRLFEIATEGDYTTPTCASCGIKMIVKTAAKGRSEGSSFWGCPNYPRCTQTFRMSGAT